MVFCTVHDAYRPLSTTRRVGTLIHIHYHTYRRPLHRNFPDMGYLLPERCRRPRWHRRRVPAAAAGRGVTVGHRPSEHSRPAAASQPLAALGGANMRWLSCAQRAAAGSAPLLTANTRPSAFLMASAAAAMLAVPASISASTLQAAMGVRDIRVCGRHPQRGPCAREVPVRTVAGGAKDRAPWRRTSLPTCSRQPLQCEDAPFTATVKQAAQQQAPRQTWCEGSTGEHAPLLRDYLAAAPAMPPRCARAQLSAESRSSSAGTIAGSRGARGALMSVVYARGPFLPYHTPP